LHVEVYQLTLMAGGRFPAQDLDFAIVLQYAMQARHTLEHILRTQIQQKRDALKQVQQQTQDIQQKIAAAVQQLATPVGDSAESAAPG
jgi:hypothetical protein